MRVLWITNTIFPALCRQLGIEPPVAGGWMYDTASILARTSGVELAIASTHSVKEVDKYDIQGIRYYLLPRSKITEYPTKLEPVWKEICEDFKPDIVHIHGTEFAHGLACMRSCPQLSYIISIQGLVSISAKYYYAGIAYGDIVKNITIRDILKMDTLFDAKRNFLKRGQYEKEYLSRAKNVIGRTSWDLAHVKKINPLIKYHFCNETLRSSFYQSRKWNADQKIRFSIFLSQASYPLKGLHKVLEAVSLLKSEIPSIKVRVAGPSIINVTTLKEKIRLSGYGAYIRRLIKKYKLQDQVTFLGNLDESRMIEEYLNAHLFICPSSIENSPNSIGEAQLLGVPVVAAYVGGIPDMVEHGKTGLFYRFEETEMLAEQIKRIFTDKNLVMKLSNNGIEAANIRHHEKTNIERTVEIYEAIARENVCC